ncbi:MAG: rhodanese-like domain-containing protein [Bacteroidota bacterium]
MITRVIIVLLLFISCKDATSQNGYKITDFDVENENVILIDVRTPKEFAEGHLSGAENINIYDEDFKDRCAKFDKQETIYVYCRSGSRSAKAQHILQAIGFTNVINLEGGFLSWEVAKKPIAH